MDYIEVVCSLKPYSEANSEICCAKLGEVGFESFVNTEDGLLAYIQEPGFGFEKLNEVTQEMELLECQLNYRINKIEDQNWNATWESSFDPVVIDDKCIVRAPFHEVKQKFEYDIEIEPKMSFGTGHHATTSQMIRYMLQTDFTNKIVLDMGCGTAVLAVLANMLGAKEITAIDVEEWAYNNSIENIKRNNCNNITVLKGDAQLLNDKRFDIVLANINRNILMMDIEKYAACMPNGGLLFLSGFYSEDLPGLVEECQKHGLDFDSNLEHDNWIAAKFTKTR